MLDHAKELGILGSVSDEGDYWEKRDVKALAEDVGEWNEKIAGLVGKLKDTSAATSLHRSLSIPTSST